MEPGEIGLVRAVTSIALLLTTFSSFGTGGTIIRYYSILGSTQRILNQLFTFAVVTILIAYTTLAFSLLLFEDSFFDFFEEKSPQLGQYLVLITMLVLQMAIFNLLEFVVRTQKEIIIPSIIRDLCYKVLHMIVILFFGMGLIELNEYIHSISIIYLILLVLLGVYIRHKRPLKLDFTFFTDINLLSNLYRYSSVGILTGLGYILMLQIDQVMISKYLGLNANGIYTTAIFISVAVEIPNRFISQISSTLISDAIAEDNMQSLKDIYQNASINQLILGSFIYGLILINLENIYLLMPNGQSFLGGWWIFMIIGLVKLMDMVFSTNSEIIAYSRHYKFNLYIMLLLSILSIILNYMLIPIYGIVGAALSTMISYLFFNLSKYLFIRVRFNLIPFTLNTIKGSIVILIVVCLALHIPKLENIYADSIFRSLIYCGVFIVVIYILDISSLFNKMIIDMINALKLKSD